jgi:hypothetical protein
MEPCGIQLDKGTLEDYALRLLSEEERARIEKHLRAGCPACQEHLDWLSATLPALSLEFVAPPRSALRQAQKLFQERQKTLSPLQRLAELLFDSRTTTPAWAGVRSAEETTFQQLYSAETYDIDLWGQREESGNYYLIGQVRSRENGNSLIPSAVLLTSLQAESQVAFPEGNEFHLSFVAPGRYNIKILLPESGILLSDVQIGG